MRLPLPLYQDTRRPTPKGFRLGADRARPALGRDGAAAGGAPSPRRQRARACGHSIPVDTGYSSLAYLQQCPVDVLKIDKAFVDQVGEGRSEAAIARTIVTLAEMLGLHTVAEGIERPEQHAGLRALGCRLGQGFHYARPLPPAEALEFPRCPGGAIEVPEMTIRRRALALV